MRFVDSHLHLDQMASPGGAILMAEWSQVLLFSSGTDKGTSLATLGFSRRSPSTVRAFVGVHPSECTKEPDLGWLDSASKEASGVGEIGLDPKYSPCGPRSPQMKAFETQLGLAEKNSKPVQVHSRGAEGPALDTIEGFRTRGVLMHWFEEEGLFERVMDRGYFVSFGPALLSSKKLQRLAAKADRGLVLTETDAPVPFAALGGAQGPTLIPSVLFKLAEVWRVTFEEARSSVELNASRYLASDGKG